MKFAYYNFTRNHMLIFASREPYVVCCLASCVFALLLMFYLALQVLHSFSVFNMSKLRQSAGGAETAALSSEHQRASNTLSANCRAIRSCRREGSGSNRSSVRKI